MQKRNRRDRAKLPDFAKNLNASQRGLLTKFTRTGQLDMTNKVTAERPIRRAAWEKRKQAQAEKEAA